MTDLKYYTIQEAAMILRVHDNTIYNWIHAGILKAEKFGDLWRIPADEIERKQKKIGV